MPRNGSGTFTLVAGNPVVSGTPISSTVQNNTMSDVGNEITNSIPRDGTAAPTNNLPMGNFKITGLGAGTVLTDSAQLGQVQSGSALYLTAVAGADTITGNLTTPALASYAAGNTFRFVAAAANTGAATLNINSLGAKAITKNGTTALSAGDIPIGAAVEVIYDGTRFQLLNVSTSGIPTAPFTDTTAIVKGSSDATKLVRIEADGLTTATTRVLTAQDKDITLGAQDISSVAGRLTLTSVTPVTTADVTAAATLYYTPYTGNKISLYDGTNWLDFISAEISIAVPATTSQMYDVFIYNNAGTPTLELTAWTNDTTRATALTYQNGVLVKTGVLTRRYLGSFRTTTVSGQTEDSIAKRYLWNYYNRILRVMRAVDTTDTWTYTLATLRQANANTANQLDMVIGVSEDLVQAEAQASCNNGGASGGTQIVVGIGLDSTSVNSAQIFSRDTNAGVAAVQVSAKYLGYPGVGRHTMPWLEYSTASGATTWYGDNGAPTLQQSGIQGMIRG